MNVTSKCIDIFCHKVRVKYNKVVLIIDWNVYSNKVTLVTI